MPNMNDPAELTFYYTAPLFLPCTIEDPNFLGVYSSTSALPTTANNFNTAGVAGTGAMYVYLNNSWQFVGQYLHDAYRYLVYYQGSSFASASGTKWSSIFNDIASNSSLMTEFSANSASASNLSASSIAMNAIIGNSSALNTVVGSSTAMNAIAGSSTAMNAIIGNSSALNTVVGSSTAMNAIAGSSTAMSIVVDSSPAMQAVAGSSTAMQAVGNSTTAMNDILPNSNYANAWWGSSYYVGLGLNTYAGLNNSTLAGLNTISAIASNSTAMSAIAGSSPAMQAVGNSTTAMNTILPSSTYVNTWWGSSYYVGLGLNTYVNFNNSTLAGLNTVSAIANNSTAMSIIAGSSYAMNAIAASSTAMNAIANSSTAMNAVIASYTAMNTMTTLAAKNAFQSASSQLSYIQTLVSNINSGTIALGGGTAGSSSALGLNALLVLLSYDNGAAVPAGNATSSPTPTLASKMYTAYSPTQNSYSSSSSASTPVVTLATNQIVFAVGAYSYSSVSVGMGNASGYSTSGTNASNILYTTSASIAYPNEGTSPLLLSGTLYVEVQGGYMAYYYYLTYTPS